MQPFMAQRKPGLWSSIPVGVDTALDLHQHGNSWPGRFMVSDAPGWGGGTSSGRFGKEKSLKTGIRRNRDSLGGVEPQPISAMNKRGSQNEILHWVGGHKFLYIWFIVFYKIFSAPKQHKNVARKL